MAPLVDILARHGSIEWNRNVRREFISNSFNWCLYSAENSFKRVRYIIRTADEDHFCFRRMFMNEIDETIEPVQRRHLLGAVDIEAIDRTT